MELATVNKTKTDVFHIQTASEEHVKFAETISDMYRESAKMRGIGIANRPPDYIAEKMRNGNAIIALHEDGRLAGFCYIETWSHGKYVVNSGLIVSSEFRKQGLAKRIKQTVFNLSRTRYPEAKIFGITTSSAVMKINSQLGYRPVTYSELTTDQKFWDGCQSCPNYDILNRNKRKHCLCTAMLYDPEEVEKRSNNSRDKEQ